MAKSFPESLPDDPENVPECISTCQDDHFRDSDLGTTLSTGSLTCRQHVGEYRTRLVNEIVFFLLPQAPSGVWRLLEGIK